MADVSRDRQLNESRTLKNACTSGLFVCILLLKGDVYWAIESKKESLVALSELERVMQQRLPRLLLTFLYR